MKYRDFIKTVNAGEVGGLTADAANPRFNQRSGIFDAVGRPVKSTPSPFPGICRSCSKCRSRGGLGHQMQIAGIGSVAPQPERLASSRRRHLPRCRILQRRYKCAAVWGRDLQGHFYKPVVDGRKREFF